MVTPITEKTKETDLAEEVIRRCMKNIKEKIYSFVFALEILNPVPVVEGVLVCTNGKDLFYNPTRIMQMCKMGRVKAIEHTICHILMHGLLGHFEETTKHNQKLSWAVMDIQVKRCMEVLYKEYNNCGAWTTDNISKYFNSDDEEMVLDHFLGDELYYKGKKDSKVRKQVYRIGYRAKRDDHVYWDYRLKMVPDDGGESEADSRKRVLGEWRMARQIIVGKDDEENADKLTKKVYKYVKSTTRTRKYGRTSANCENEVDAANNQGNAYNQLLREIVSCTEVIREEEELDKVLYQYGLEMYGDVPLVEPEEMTEKPQLHTIVLAVDTSGSCTNRASQFLQEILNIFEEIQNIADIEHLCYLECDTEIAKEDNYYDVDEFISWGRTYKFQGGGGTDFCPVFDKADELVKKGEKVDALLYLTDGDGEFPEYKDRPPYPVFLLLDIDDSWDDDWDMPEIPEWATPILLDFPTYYND